MRSTVAAVQTVAPLRPFYTGSAFLTPSPPGGVRGRLRPLALFAWQRDSAVPLATGANLAPFSEYERSTKLAPQSAFARFAVLQSQAAYARA